MIEHRIMRKIFVLLVVFSLIMACIPMAFAAEEDGQSEAQNEVTIEAETEPVKEEVPEETQPSEEQAPEESKTETDEEAPKADNPEQQETSQSQPEDKKTEGPEKDSEPVKEPSKAAEPAAKTETAQERSNTVLTAEKNEAALTADYLKTEELTRVQDNQILLYAAKRGDIDDGDTISYTVTRIGENNHKPYFQSGSYQGLCIEPGKEANDDGGRAKATVLPKSDIRVRTAYYVSVVLNYWPTGQGNDNTTDVDKRNARINRAERAVQYASNPQKTLDRMHELDYSQETIDRIVGYVETARGITVPESFEAFACDPTTDNQGFILYKYHAGYISLKKNSANIHYNHPENYSLAGATYYIYTNQACTVRAQNRHLDEVSLVTDANGSAGPVEVATGTYYVKEVTPSPGHALDTRVYTVTVTDDNTSNVPAKVTSSEPDTDGYVYVKKQAAASDTSFLTAAPNNYSLAGAVYYLYKDEACTVRAKDKSGNNITFTTRADGTTSAVKVDLGRYWAKEITASKGYRLDSAKYAVTVTAANTASSPAIMTSTEPPTWAELFKLRKIDKSGRNGWKNLLGTKYRISYYDADPSVTDVSGLTAKRSWVFETVKKTDSRTGDFYAGIDFTSDEPLSGDAFYTEGGKRILPCGVFTLEEIEAPAGMARDTTVYYGKVYQPTNGAAALRAINTNNAEDLSFEIGTGDSVINQDKPQSVTIAVDKKSALTGEAAADGTERNYVKGSLAGAKYDVYFDDPRKPKPVKIGTIITDEIGHGEISEYEGEDLDLGRYYVEEVKASDGYVIDGLYFNNEPGRYENGRHVVDARAIELDTGNFTYTVESLEPPHETHVYKRTITGEELPGATLQVFDSAGNMIEEWVSTTEPHDIIALHDETQGLKDGTYTLREITAPYGYDTAEDVVFTVSSHEIENTVEMKNAPIEIETNAKDDATQTHVGMFAAEEKITDVVTFRNLYAGRTYTFTGILMDKETRKPVLDKDGNEVTAEKSCTFDENGKLIEGEYTGPAGKLISGSVELEFIVDASQFTKETSVVAFETVSRKGRELAMHADLTDEDQTIHYGGIVGTAARDKETLSHNLLAGKNATVIDTVEYHNLAPDETYVISGELYDKTTGSTLQGVSAKAIFEPKKSDGEIEVEFSFDATGLENHALVAFEKIHVRAIIGDNVRDILIDEHKDPEDADQTMWIPEIRTNATDMKTGDHIANGSEEVSVKDVVTYKNLIPGKTYEMKGTLMDKDTGKPVMVNGSKVTAAKPFTPSGPNGSVELTFTFNGVSLRGKKLVAFEECTVIGKKVAVHADIKDADQTVSIPKIATRAGKKKGKVVVDTVKYWGLIPGKTYKVSGYLVKKSNGDRISGSSGEITFIPQTPDGSIKVELEYGKATGKLVAFESIYLVDNTNAGEPRLILIGEHQDLKDAAQTVNITTIPPKTGDKALLWLYAALFIGAFGSMLALVIKEYAEKRRQNREDAEMFV